MFTLKIYINNLKDNSYNSNALKESKRTSLFNDQIVLTPDGKKTESHRCICHVFANLSSQIIFLQTAGNRKFQNSGEGKNVQINFWLHVVQSLFCLPQSRKTFWCFFAFAEQELKIYFRKLPNFCEMWEIFKIEVTS